MKLLFLLPVVFLVSCYHHLPPMSPEERAESSRRLHEIEDENFGYRDRERRSAARAIREANGGAPVHYHQHSHLNGW